MVFFEFGGGVQDYCFSLQYEVPYLKTKDLRNTDSASATVSFADNPWRSYLYQRSPDPKPKLCSGWFDPLCSQPSKLQRKQNLSGLL